MTRPVGVVTRGTTNPNRLRRVDRWIAGVLGPQLRQQPAPLVVDLGFGATPTTTVELAGRLARAVPRARVAGVEIDPSRVNSARAAHPGVEFALGGFELGPHRGEASVVRAFNVLRQYDEAEVRAAWRTMCRACVAGGTVIDGTCDELGRLSSWIRVDADTAEPVSLTISVRLAGLLRPSEVAPRLPKALIHHNLPGTPIHAYLAALDACWAESAGWQGFGVRQRWLRSMEAVRYAGYRVLDGPNRWRLGEVSVAWVDVAPYRAGEPGD